VTGGAFRVLYVDPDAATADRVAAALEAQSAAVEIEFESATDAPEAMTRLGEAASIDCVVSAHTLPDGTGIELLRTIRESFPELPCVLFTGVLSIGLVREAIDAGVTDILPRDSDGPDDADVSLLAERVVDVVTQYRAAGRTRELERIHGVIRHLHRGLVHASSAPEIDRRVCEIFSRSDPYVFAWVGEYDPGSKTVTARAAAGIEEGYLDAVTITVEDGATARGPTGRAIRTREVAVMQNLSADPAYEPWREQALERGYRSSAAIPLVHDGALYGVLNVYADRTGAFDAEERELLEDLGETIAYAHYDVLLHEEARRFQRAVEQAADAVFITDVEGTIEYVNPSFESLTGYAASEAVGRNPRILKSGEQSREYYESMWESILDGEVWEGEVVNERKSGERYHAEQTVAPITDETGDIEGFVAIQRDITEQRERERELRQAERRLSLAIAAADAGVWEWDIENEELYWEDSMAELVGLDTETFGGTYEDFIAGVHPEDRAAVERTVRGALRRGDGFEMEYRFRHERGEYLWLLTRAQLLTDAEGRAERVTGISVDISERVDRTEQLRVLDRVLRHNLRNDMSVILGHAETIRDDGEAASSAAEAILAKGRTLLETVDKEREIVETISEPPEQTEVDVVDVCARIVETARERHPDAVIEFDAPATAPAGATGKLGRAISELLENAVVHNDSETPTVSIAVERRAETVRIAVADNGPGVPEAERKVLTREKEVEPLYHGSGLGLRLVNWIVRRSAGTLEFAENAPRGSVVTIELPAST